VCAVREDGLPIGPQRQHVYHVKDNQIESLEKDVLDVEEVELNDVRVITPREHRHDEEDGQPLEDTDAEVAAVPELTAKRWPRGHGSIPRVRVIRVHSR